MLHKKIGKNEICWLIKMKKEHPEHKEMINRQLAEYMPDTAYITNQYFIYRGSGMNHSDALKQARLDNQLKNKINYTASP